MYLVLGPDIKNLDLLKPFDEKFELELPWKMPLEYDYNSKVCIYVFSKYYEFFYNKKFDGQVYKQITKEIRDFYFPNHVPVNKESLPQLNALLSDLWFVNGVDRSAKYEIDRSKNGKIFMYKYVDNDKLLMIDDL